jgi:hypothetical protein
VIDPRQMNPHRLTEPRVPAVADLSRLGTMGVLLLAYTTADVRTVHWVPEYRTHQVALPLLPSPLPGRICRQVGLCARSKYWAACTMSNAKPNPAGTPFGAR